MTQTIEQLTARVRELEEELLKTKMDLLTSYGESEELLGRIAELEAEVERLKRTNSSYANLTKAQESQLTNLRQRLYQLKGADSAIDSERQANCDLTEQLAAEQLNNKLLREALSAAEETIDIVWVSHHANRCDRALELCRKALATPISTEALDKYVAEKVKEATEKLHYRMEHCYSIDGMKAILDLDEMTRQRDLAVEALERQLADAKHCQQVMCNEVGIGFLDVVTLSNSEAVLSTIKESEGKHG